MTAKKENRGGARPNSGPKPQTVSASQLKEMREAAAEFAKEHGKTLFQVCLDWIGDESLKIDRRQAAWKMYTDKMLIQASEGGEADTSLGPSIYLPEQKPTFSAVVDIQKAKKDQKDTEGEK